MEESKFYFSDEKSIKLNLVDTTAEIVTFLLEINVDNPFSQPEYNRNFNLHRQTLNYINLITVISKSYPDIMGQILISSSKQFKILFDQPNLEIKKSALLMLYEILISPNEIYTVGMYHALLYMFLLYTQSINFSQIKQRLCEISKNANDIFVFIDKFKFILADSQINETVKIDFCNVFVDICFDSKVEFIFETFGTISELLLELYIMKDSSTKTLKFCLEIINLNLNQKSLCASLLLDEDSFQKWEFMNETIKNL